MSNSQQNFNVGSTRGHTQAKTEEWTQSAKDTANAAIDKTTSSGDTAQQKKEEAHGFLQQTGEQIANMTQGAIDGVKNTLGVGNDSAHKK